MTPQELSVELRTGTGLYLAQRRGIVGCGMVAAAAMGVIALYQIGLIRHLPEPPWPGLDADKVDASAEAYSYFQTPDAFLGLGSYAVTMGLAAMGATNRAAARPWIPLALLAKVLADAGQAAKLTVDQWTKHRAFCLWCLIAATATFVSLPLALPEAVAALQQVRKRS
jgi:uncharacterized membrane protein